MAQKSDELKAFNDIVSALRGLEPDKAESVIRSVLTFLGMSLGGVHHPARSGEVNSSTAAPVASPSFSEDRALSPKQFLLQKQPRSDVERVACLAYYLTHYRETPHFKTLELSKLNTEAAQPKFSNAAFSSRNAVNLGYLAPATKGQRQLSAAGELFVTNLPDRAAAKEAMMTVRRKKSARKPKNQKKAK
jgi:hypothetical protein